MNDETQEYMARKLVEAGNEIIRLRAALRELLDASAFAIYGDGEAAIDVAWENARSLVEGR